MAGGNCALCGRLVLVLTELPNRVMVCPEHVSGDYDARPQAGFCNAVGGHYAPHVYTTPRFGPLCKDHLHKAFRIAVWPDFWDRPH